MPTGRINQVTASVLTGPGGPHRRASVARGHDAVLSLRYRSERIPERTAPASLPCSLGPRNGHWPPRGPNPCTTTHSIARTRGFAWPAERASRIVIDRAPAARQGPTAPIQDNLVIDRANSAFCGNETCRRRRKARVRLPKVACAVNNSTGGASKSPGLPSPRPPRTGEVA